MCERSVWKSYTNTLLQSVLVHEHTHTQVPSKLSSAVKKLSISPIMDILSFVLK